MGCGFFGVGCGVWHNFRVSVKNCLNFEGCNTKSGLITLVIFKKAGEQGGREQGRKIIEMITGV
ncbi:MAG TPA: hypothetical protein DD000_05175 [Cyanobacteria bacterium UBA11166]|nr:hypothetical protein [Cyanobacteria bacterium UBA11166]